MFLYDRLRAGQVTKFEARSLADLPEILIQARIARGLSQRELGDYLGLKEQQVQRYEAERYRSASLDRLVEVSDALGVQIARRAELVGDSALGSVDPRRCPALRWAVDRPFRSVVAQCGPAKC
jgi:HTH-type transcriptional regulator/antitoxin HigA